MSKGKFIDRLKTGKILLSDGGYGSMLIGKGLQPGECPDELNLSKPEWISDIAKNYVEAGADIIHAFTFGSSPVKLAEYGLENKTGEINKKGVAIVQEAAKKDTFISASVGPSGRILKPYGDTEPEVLLDSFVHQIEALKDLNLDLLTIETMIDLSEVILAVKAIRSIMPDIPVMASMTFNETPRGFYTIVGSSVKQAADGMLEAGVDVVGSNCGNGLDKMIKIAREFADATDAPVLIQSNAGLPETKDGKLYYSETPDFFAERTGQLIDAGTAVIGGCCGTTPEHIKRIRTAVDRAAGK